MNTEALDFQDTRGSGDNTPMKNQLAPTEDVQSFRMQQAREHVKRGLRLLKLPEEKTARPPQETSPILMVLGFAVIVAAAFFGGMRYDTWTRQPAKTNEKVRRKKRVPEEEEEEQEEEEEEETYYKWKQANDEKRATSRQERARKSGAADGGS